MLLLRQQLVYAKGEHYYEDAPVNNSRWEDLDMALVEDYVKVIGYGKGAETYLRENGYVVKKEDYRGREYEALTGAAVLLFGKNPQRFFQRAQVRVIRWRFRRKVTPCVRFKVTPLSDFKMTPSFRFKVTPTFRLKMTPCEIS